MIWGLRAGAGALLVVLVFPSVPETMLPPREDLVPRPRRLLDAELSYPSPPRTTLEIETVYEAGAGKVDAGRGSRGVIALTFDTEIPRGSEARQTVNEILDVLRRAEVHATFFVVGTWARANVDVLRRIASEGHELANHSFDHRAFAGRRTSDLRSDLAKVAALVEQETGKPIAPLFRPPYGCLDAAAALLVDEQGYGLVGWTAAGRDAEGSTESPREVVEEISGDLGHGAVVLLHTNRWITAAALPGILQAAQEREPRRHTDVSAAVAR